MGAETGVSDVLCFIDAQGYLWRMFHFAVLPTTSRRIAMCFNGQGFLCSKEQFFTAAGAANHCPLQDEGQRYWAGQVVNICAAEGEVAASQSDAGGNQVDYDRLEFTAEDPDSFSRATRKDAIMFLMAGDPIRFQKVCTSVEAFSPFLSFFVLGYCN